MKAQDSSQRRALLSGRLQRLSRSLRLRLTASYAIFFTILLTLLSLVFRQFLAQSLDEQLRAAINQDWTALRGYLRFTNGKPNWYVDPTDPDDVALKTRLRRVFFAADAKGNEMKGNDVDISDIYQALGADSKSFIQNVIVNKQPVWRERTDKSGKQYLIRSGILGDEDPINASYYVAIGRSLEDNRNILRRFTWLCVALIPLIALGGSVLGWVYTGRALSPVMDIARTAQRISGSNLSMRIPTRKTGDELDYLSETFNRMIERLELSFNQIRQFSTDVSHELRTPITVVRGQLEVALFTAQTAEDYREAIVDSLHDIERLSAIVRALLLLSQAETGQVLLQRTRLDLCEVIHDLVDQFQIPAESAQVHVFVSEAPPDCHADVDRVQVERMISNLLSNAVKFTPPGGQVNVALHERGEDVEIVIRDTGRGIAPEHLPHIFDRFYRIAGPSADSSPEKGLGLGLSFVAWIAKAHGGSVEVISQLGEGTTFTVSFPRNFQAPPPSTPKDLVDAGMGQAGLKQT